VGNIRGFRCRLCQAEVLTGSLQSGLVGLQEWIPPILSCGELLEPVETRCVLSGRVPRLRIARCVQCGFEVCIAMQPAGLLVCADCQAAIVGDRLEPGAGRAAGGTRSGYPWGGEMASKDHDGLAGRESAPPPPAGEWGPQGRRVVGGRR
jgi:hypothetical protein